MTRPAARAGTDAPPLPEAAALAADLDRDGYTVIRRWLTPEACDRLRATVMDPDRLLPEGGDQRTGQYWRDAQFTPGARLREALYTGLVPHAQRWLDALGTGATLPPTLAGFEARCRDAGLGAPLSSLSRLRSGDEAALQHRADDALAFPLQASVMLSRAGRDYTGGEFVMTEQRPRMQSRPAAFLLDQGDLVLFASGTRPFRGAQGAYRVNLRHGVSVVRTGERCALDLVFHAARDAAATQDR
ncbi:2OG-Fe(II) oxygenase [Burkholderia sp. FERM BP-3421]|uniref:2OG-Fe(II) oxygenase n=1 Tax=Burkholderia sp. FERM BP-3421 TaxID=1494466 RepID=UPI0023611044|nr:2OG-Fe(II) oxygenase [Burkholderia sp. FERM BP-3421]WDD93129.1 2OG-Fe(II) oxygenase [Burkholderia sp. FERM BP-3421]